MTQNTQKKIAAEAAMEFVEPGMIVGVGTGSTVNYFIDALAAMKHDIEGTVVSSEASAKRLKSHGIRVFDLNVVNDVTIYVDGADEINQHMHMIKGGGGALTREKVVASVASKFICIADESKKVEILGTFPIAVEVIPLARSYVGREIVKLGGDPVYRENFITDNGNIILDVYNMKLFEPIKMEEALNNINGVVCNGIFAKQQANCLLLGTDSGVIKL